MEKNIGKNTIGDNNKMSDNRKTYNMSTHDLSTVVRNTRAPGTLVPNLTLLVQKGDIIDIDIESNVLTHPTVGPLFGSFKLEHHVYTVPFRLYNSWLHNNRTKKDPFQGTLTRCKRLKIPKGYGKSKKKGSQAQ